MLESAGLTSYIGIVHNSPIGLAPGILAGRRATSKAGHGEQPPMIKIDIVKRIADHLKLKDSESLAVVDAVIDAIKETICENERLEVRDFGVFQTKVRKPRVGRNPRNRQEYPIPPRRVVTFKLGKELKDFSVERSGPSRSIDGSEGGSPGKPGSASVKQDSFLSGDSE